MDFERMLSYCAALAAHNDRAWFHENHKFYEEAQRDFAELLELARFAVAEAAPDIAEDIMYAKARDWMYRIPRDMRVNRGKPPYNPSFRAYISADKKSWLPIGYFLRIEPENSCFGTGVWMPDSAGTNRLREYISAHALEFEDIVEQNSLVFTGERLKRMPRGFDEDAPAAEWLKFKEWLVIEEIADAELGSFDDFCGLLRRVVARMEPMRKFLLAAATGEIGQKQAFEEFYSI